MMGFSVLFIFALTHIFILCAGGNSEDLSNITDSSNPHHLHPRQRFGRGSAKKEEDQSSFLDTNLEFVLSNNPDDDDAVLVSHNNDYYYILGIGECKKEQLGTLKSTEMLKPGANKEKRGFLVNKDNFEILEWKTWAEIKKGQSPFYPIMICKSKYITKDNNGIDFMTRGSLKKSSEVLTVNYEVKGQDFQTENCEEKKKVKPDKIEVIKRVTADNMNCEKAKHVVKYDEGSDKTRSFLKSRTHTVGGAAEASASGSILSLVQLSGKLSGKYDYSRLNSETTSRVDKDQHSVSMEIEVPPKHSCTIEIKSKTFTFESLCSGRLTRLYKNGEVRTTSIAGIYKEEVTDLLTSMNPCTPVKDGAKCSNV